MKTVCCKTEPSVRRRDNIVDFCAYRERMMRTRAAAAGDELTFHWEVDESVWRGAEPRRRAQPVRRTSQNHPAAKKPIGKKSAKAKKSPERLDLWCLLGSMVIVSVVWLGILF